MKKETKGSQHSEIQSHGTLENLLYWLKVLYGESPGFVWLYLLGIGVTIGISWLGVYMSSVLVEDITAGEGIEGILRDLAFLGGGLVCLHLLNNLGICLTGLY